MTKLTFLILAVFSLITYIYADCSDGILICYDKRDIRIGHALYGRCWRQLVCLPCKRRYYKEYLQLCQYKYPTTVKVESLHPLAYALLDPAAFLKSG